MTLETRELRAFTVLAAELHFRKASDLLFISQPALTRQIQHLEEKIGGALFSRTRRKVVLSEAGRALLPRAGQLLRDLDEAVNCVREVTQGRAGCLRIGFGIASICDILPRAILRFRKGHPRVELQMRDMSTASQIACLLRDEIDVGLVRISAAPAEANGFPLFRERLVVAAPPAFPYNARHGLPGLADAPFIILPPSVSRTFHEHVFTVCRKAGFVPRVVQEAGEMFTILNLVRSGVGVSLVPRAASRMNVPGVVYYELRGSEAEWQIGPIWRKTTPKLALIRAFCEALQAVTDRRPPTKDSGVGRRGVKLADPLARLRAKNPGQTRARGVKDVSARV